MKAYQQIVNEDDFYIDWDCEEGWMKATHTPSGKSKTIHVNCNTNLVQASRSIMYWMTKHFCEI